MAICESCGGHGHIKLATPLPIQLGNGLMGAATWVVCPECGQQGVVSCCEGSERQFGAPELPPAPQFLANETRRHTTPSRPPALVDRLTVAAKSGLLADIAALGLRAKGLPVMRLADDLWRVDSAEMTTRTMIEFACKLDDQRRGLERKS